MIVNKFGGEIMGDTALVKLAVKNIKSQLKAGQKPIVVVSALKGVTDELVALCDKYDYNTVEKLDKAHQAWLDKFKIKNSRPPCFPPAPTCPRAARRRGRRAGALRSGQAKLKIAIKNLKLRIERNAKLVRKVKNKAAVMDKIFAVGEKWASLLFTELLCQNNINAVRFTGEKLGVITDDNFGDADINYVQSVRNIRRRIKSEKLKVESEKYKAKGKSRYIVPVITGFIGRTIDGKTTTLGRGGSDTTACLVGAALKASRVILWKNVAGVLSADPKIVPSAKTIKSLNYEEAEESGKVIHDKAMRLVRQADVTVEVSYIQNPRQKTVITRYGSNAKGGVKIISSKDNLRLLVITGDKIKHAGALLEIANIISGRRINMVLIRNTMDSLYIVVEKNGHNLSDVERQVKKSGYQLKAKDVSMLNVIGKLSWHTVEKVNHLLHSYYPQAFLGAFPYHNCVRLEAVVTVGRVKRLVRVFHEELVK